MREIGWYRFPKYMLPLRQFTVNSVLNALEVPKLAFEISRQKKEKEKMRGDNRNVRAAVKRRIMSDPLIK